VPRVHSFILIGWSLLGRRLHQLEAEGLGGEHAAAAAAARASPEAASQADVAAQALAVLVRLTAHSGA
jgi:ATP-dependent protease HslVU (ClpYQ) peptidase subunit